MMFFLPVQLMKQKIFLYIQEMKFMFFYFKCKNTVDIKSNLTNTYVPTIVN